MLPQAKTSTPAAEAKRSRTKRPAHAGRNWTALPFDVLLDTVRDECRKAGWGLGDWSVHIHRAGADIAASAPAPGADRGVGAWGLTPHVGIAASNVMRRTLTAYVGVRANRSGGAVVMCKYKSAARHTVNHDTAYYVKPLFAFRGVQGEANVRHGLARLAGIVERLKADKLNQSRMILFLHAAGRARLMPWSRIGRVEDLLGNKRFMQGRRGVSAWDLLEAFGVISDANTPRDHMDRLYGFYRIVVGRPPEQIESRA